MDKTSMQEPVHAGLCVDQFQCECCVGALFFDRRKQLFHQKCTGEELAVRIVGCIVVVNVKMFDEIGALREPIENADV